MRTFDLVENGKVLGTYSDKLAEHKLADAKAQQEAKPEKLKKLLKQLRKKQMQEDLLII